MGRFDRTCKVCGIKYDYCPNCSKYANLPKWMTLFHDENCREIFQVAEAYYNNELNADDLKIKLSKFNDDFKKSVVNESVKKMLEETSAKRSKKKSDDEE